MNTKQFSAPILLVGIIFLTLGVTAQEVAVSPSALPEITEPKNTESENSTQQVMAVNPQGYSETAVANQTPTSNTQPAPVTPFYQNTNSAAPKVGSGSHLLTVTLGLMAIVGLIFALSWFVKRFTQGGFSGNAHIKILSAMPLGTRERLVLIETGGQQLLIGVTANNINTLHVLTTPIAIPEKTDITSEFSKKLMAIMQQKNVVAAASATTTNNNNTAG